MIDTSLIDKAIENMKTDIILTNYTLQDNMQCDNYEYYISIYANDRIALTNSIKLLKSLNIKSKSITMIPKSYKSCEFDCFSISSIFNDLHSDKAYNVDTISIIERSDLEYGNFHISIIRQNINTSLIDIIAYNTLAFYCKE